MHNISDYESKLQVPRSWHLTKIDRFWRFNQTLNRAHSTGRSWVSPTNGKRPHPPQPAPLTFSISNIFVLECFSPSQFIPKWKCFSLGLFSCWGSILWPKDGLNQQQHIGRPVVMPPLLLLLYLHFADVLQFLALMMLWSIWKQGRLDLGRLRHRFC